MEIPDILDMQTWNFSETSLLRVIVFRYWVSGMYYRLGSVIEDPNCFQKKDFGFNSAIFNFWR